MDSLVAVDRAVKLVEYFAALVVVVDRLVEGSDLDLEHYQVVRG